MIQVIYYKTYNRLTINGHANSDEFGHDLVCAAVSTLAHTLAADVANLEQTGIVTDTVLNLEQGNAEISCKPKRKYSNLVNAIFNSVAVGFDILANKSPEFVSYEIHA